MTTDLIEPSFEAPQINMTDPSAVDYWSRSLGATPDGLRHAIAHVGTSVNAVRNYLMAGMRSAQFERRRTVFTGNDS